MDKPPELMSDAELAHALDRCDADQARTETRRLRLVAAMDKSGYAERVGARDMVQYLEFRYRLDRSRAYRDVKLSRALPKYAAVTAALPDPDSAVEDGEIPEVLLRPAQAEAIVFGLEKVPTTVPVEDLEFAEQELVRQARYLSPADLRAAAEQSRDILDTDGPEPEEDKAAARETLTLKTADRGVKFNGYLANENAELLRTLIFTGARPHKTIDGERDPRSREKRQADALTTTLTLAATALDAGTPSPTMPRPTNTPPASTHTGSTDAGSTAAGPTTAGPMAETTTDAGRGSDGGGDGGAVAGSGGDVVPGFGAKANITVTIDLEDLKAMTADAIGQTVYSNGLSAAAIRRLACDAKVIPIVLGSNSEPLDVGRCERLVTRAMRRALNTRDRGCVVCGAPPIMCDAHHLISWIDGGETKISNLVLLCRCHHTDLHNGHWTITITNGEVHVARPTWADPTHPARANSSPPATQTPSQHPPTPTEKPSTPPPPPPTPSPSPPPAGRRSAVEQRRLAVGQAQPRGAQPSNSSEKPPVGADTSASAREAAYLAIWGEPLPHEGRSTSEIGALGNNRTVDPWGDLPPDAPAEDAEPERIPQH